MRWLGNVTSQKVGDAVTEANRLCDGNPSTCISKHHKQSVTLKEEFNRLVEYEKLTSYFSGKFEEKN
jgi:hypothetical protein